jgi:hypothetical protein
MVKTVSYICFIFCLDLCSVYLLLWKPVSLLVLYIILYTLMTMFLGSRRADNLAAICEPIV